MNSNDKIVLITGGFDPLHSGHIELINSASKLGKVVVGLNSDDWLTRKKGSAFLCFEERKQIVENLKNVMLVIDFDDIDNSARNAIEKVKIMFPNNKIIFGNGGDRTISNIPEKELFENDTQIEFVFEIGGSNKKNSSSWILSNWTNNNFEKRKWGLFKTLYTYGHEVKIKELVLEPECSISLQKHQKRNEFWVVLEGGCIIQYGHELVDLRTLKYSRGQFIHIEKNMIHKLINSSKINKLKLLEIQHGEMCNESDIERFE
jgi:cytidyltransferase-like protein